MNNLDDYVGDIVAKLEVLGLTEDTLIIFTSDNGPHQEAGHDPVYFDSNGPLRGFKRDLYEGGIRVPMITCGQADSCGKSDGSYFGFLGCDADIGGGGQSECAG